MRTAAPALVAALLFRAGTPLGKLIGGEMPPLLLAGLLHVGSGVGIGSMLMIRRVFNAPRAQAPEFNIPRADWPRLLGAIAAGGMLGPALLMTGLASNDATLAACLKG